MSDTVSYLQGVVANVLPDGLPSMMPPLNVVYKSGAEVGYGNTLTPSHVVDEPSIRFDGDDDAFYTLIKTDPDAPSRDNPAFREFVHWVVVNIPGSDVAKGTTVAPYVGAGPPHNSGNHGYIFLLYKQPAQLTAEQVEAAKTYFAGRGGLKAATWAKDQGFGNPVSVRAYEASWDESVDALHEQLGFMPPEEYQSPKQKASLAPPPPPEAEPEAQDGMVIEGVRM